MKRTYKRRNYFIDKSFQAKFILQFCLVVIVSSLLLGTLMFYLSRDSTTVAIENTKVTVKSTADFILPILVTTLIVSTVFSALWVLVLTLFTSHKIAGPLYRLQREIEALKECDLTRNFTIRDKDQLQSLAKSLDEMCKSLRDKQLELKAKYKSLQSFLRSKEISTSSEENEKILEMLEEIEQVLDYFKA